MSLQKSYYLLGALYGEALGLYGGGEGPSWAQSCSYSCWDFMHVSEALLDLLGYKEPVYQAQMTPADSTWAEELLSRALPKFLTLRIMRQSRIVFVLSLSFGLACYTAIDNQNIQCSLFISCWRCKVGKGFSWTCHFLPAVAMALGLKLGSGDICRSPES